MPRILIKCSKTQQPVDTGLTADEESFERGDIRDTQVYCPHCQEVHAWNKYDAWLEGSEERAGAATG